MRLHRMTISPRNVTLDGVQLIVDLQGPTVEELTPDLTIVHLPLICETVTLNGDQHDSAETTPIYDTLIKGNKHG